MCWWRVVRISTTQSIFQDLFQDFKALKHWTRSKHLQKINSYFLCTLWQQKWSGRTSQRALSFQHEGETMAPLTRGWPPPAPTPANIKKMLLIINWALSVFSPSGILAMHWISRPSAAMLLPPQIQLQCRVHCLLLHKQHKKAGLLFVP